MFYSRPSPNAPLNKTSSLLRCLVTPRLPPAQYLSPFGFLRTAGGAARLWGPANSPARRLCLPGAADCGDRFESPPAVSPAPPRRRSPRPTLKSQAAEIARLRNDLKSTRSQLEKTKAALGRVEGDARYAMAELLRVTGRLHPLGVLQFLEERWRRENDPNGKMPTVLIPVSSETAAALRAKDCESCNVEDAASRRAEPSTRCSLLPWQAA